MRKISFLGVIALTLTSTPLLAASDAELVAEQAAKCWAMPDSYNYQTASARFEVTYNADGELVEIITVEYQPVRKAGEAFALSAQQAILDCANKTHVRSRTLHVVMKYTAPRPNGTLIMKKSLR